MLRKELGGAAELPPPLGAQTAVRERASLPACLVLSSLHTTTHTCICFHLCLHHIMSLTAVWACGRVCLLLVGYMQSLQRNDAVTRELGDLAVRFYPKGLLTNYLWALASPRLALPCLVLETWVIIAAPPVPCCAVRLWWGGGCGAAG